MGEWTFGILILMSFNMPKSDFDWIAKVNSVTNCSINIIIIVGGIIGLGRGCV